jgi:tetratricopeptide (TPR) repeat protein
MEAPSLNPSSTLATKGLFDRIQNESFTEARLIQPPAEHKKEETARGERGTKEETRPHKLLQGPVLNARRWAKKGDWLASQNQCRGALICYNQALRVEPGIVQVQIKRAIALQQLGEKRKALQGLKRAVCNDPFQIQGWCLLGYIYIELGGEKEALEAFKNMEGFGRNSGAKAKAMLGQALIYEKAGRLESALEKYTAARQKNPQLLDGWLGEARALRKMRRPEKALRRLDEAKDRMLHLNEHSQIAFEEGRVLRHRGKIDEAIGRLKDAVGMKMDSKSVWVELGYMHETHKGEYAEALTCYRRATNKDDQSVHGWWGQARVLRTTGHYSKALGRFNRAVQISPRTKMIWAGRGEVLFYVGEPGEALESLNRALMLDKEYAKAWSLKADILKEIGREDEAENAQDRAGSINPIYSGPNPWTHREGGGTN